MRTSCIRLRANTRVAVLYEDLLEICDGNMLSAMLLSTLVYWTDTKISQKDENLWIWKTHEGFQEDLMFDKPGMKPPHRTTISSALDLLKNKHFIEWRKNPKLALDRTRQYLVHQEEIQAAIDKLPTLESRKSDKGMSINRLSTEPATEANQEENANVGKTTLQCRKSNNATSEKRHCNVGKTTSNTSDYVSSDYPSEGMDTEETSQSSEDEQSATPSTPTEHEVPYVPDFPSTEQDSYSPVPPVSGYEKKEEDEDVRGSDRTGPTPGTEVPASPAPVVPQTRNTTHGGQTRQSTATTRQGKGTTGRTQPEKPAGRGVKGNTSNKVYFSLEGSAFRAWWEEYTGTKLDETAANARSCNALGKKESVTAEHTKMVVDEIDVNEWVKTNNVAVTPQDLANDESKMRWEKWLQSAQRRAAKAVQKPTEQKKDPERGVSGLKKWIPPGSSSMHAASL